MKHMNAFSKITFLLLLFYMVSCNFKVPSDKADNIKYIIKANAETTPVPSTIGEDAADDPAIWAHPEDPNKSRIIGTNKKDGLAVYNLDGVEIFYYSIGRINNIDLRYGFVLGQDTIDILVGSDRSKNALIIYQINSANGALENVAAREIKSKVDDVYGVCMYKSPKNEHFYAFVNGKKGQVEQYWLTANEKGVDAHLVREFSVGGQPEGMVADDETRKLYVGEEQKGIWTLGAEPGDPVDKKFIVGSGKSNQNIEFDIEGLSIYYARDGKGYLLASSQGNYSYAIFSREGKNEYITSFRITDGVVDGVEETDGLDVLNIALGEKYPNGILVVQDGFNYDNDSLANQNFKLVSWERVATMTEPNLLIDNQYQVFRK